MKLRKLVFMVVFSQAVTLQGFGQTTRILPWDDPQAYRPMPVIFVHGFATDSGSWNPAIAHFQSQFAPYGTTSKAPVQPGMTGQPGAPYLETFDYGRYGQDFGTTLPHGNLQTFDSIRMNAWDGVFQGQGQTLLDRIADIRFHYRYSDSTQPTVILICHSTGGLMAHYYLTESVHASLDPGVARVATRGAPHYGSTWANLLRADQSPDSLLRFLLLPKTALFDDLFLSGVVNLFGQPNLSNMRAFANPPRLHPEKLVMTDLSANRPGSRRRSEQNPLIPYFQANAVPGNIEYIFCSFK